MDVGVEGGWEMRLDTGWIRQGIIAVEDQGVKKGGGVLCNQVQESTRTNRSQATRWP